MCGKYGTFVKFLLLVIPFFLFLILVSQGTGSEEDLLPPIENTEINNLTEVLTFPHFFGFLSISHIW